MTKWLQRLRGVVKMGLIWAVGGAVLGGLPELADNVTPGGLPAVHVIDMWPQTLALVGFLGGVAFAVVLGIAGARRRFDELSLPRFVAWGAVAGVLLGAFVVTEGAPLLFAALVTLLSAGGAAGTLALARRSEDRELLAAAADVREAGLTEQEERELLGR